MPEDPYASIAVKVEDPYAAIAQPVQATDPRAGTIRATPNPGLIDRVRNYLGTTPVVEAISESMPAVRHGLESLGIHAAGQPMEQRTIVGNPADTLITDEDSRKSPVVAATRGAVRGAQSLTHPKAAATMVGIAATGGMLAPAAALATTVSRLVSLGFTFETAKGLVEKAPELIPLAAEGVKTGDLSKFYEHLGEMGFDATMLAQMTQHAAGGGKVTPADMGSKGGQMRYAEQEGARQGYQPITENKTLQARADANRPPRQFPLQGAYAARMQQPEKPGEPTRAEVNDTGRDIGVNLDAAQATGATLPKVVKKLGRYTITGSPVYEAATENNIKALEDAVTQEAGKMSDVKGKEAAGSRIVAALRDDLARKQETAQKLYDSLDERMGGVPQDASQSIQQEAAKIVAEHQAYYDKHPELVPGKAWAIIKDLASRETRTGEAPVSSGGAEVLDAAGNPITQSVTRTVPKTATWSELHQLRSDLMEFYRNSPDIIKGKSEAWIQRMVAAIDGQMTGERSGMTPRDLADFRQANAIWKSIQETYNNQRSPYYQALKAQASSQVPGMFMSSPEFIRSLRETLGELDGPAKRAMFESIINGKNGELDLFNMNSRLGRIDKANLVEMFGEEGAKKIQILGKLAAKITADNKGSQTAERSVPVGEAGTIGGAVTGALMGHPAVLAGEGVYLGGQYAGARAMNSPRVVDYLTKQREAGRMPPKSGGAAGSEPVAPVAPEPQAPKTGSTINDVPDTLGKVTLYRGTEDPVPHGSIDKGSFGATFFSLDQKAAGQYGKVAEHSADLSKAKVLNMDDILKDENAANAVRKGLIASGDIKPMDLPTFMEGLKRVDEVAPDEFGDFSDSIVERFMYPDKMFAAILKSEGYDGTRMGNDIALFDAKKWIQEKGAATGYGEANKLVTSAEADAARAELRSKLGNLNAGIPVDAIPAMVKLGVYHLEAGARTFADWSAKMVSEFGEKVRPHLDDIWARVQSPDESTARISTRNPTAVKATENPHRENLSIDSKSIEQAGMAPQVASIVSQYPGFKNVAKGIKDPVKVNEAFVKWAADNLTALHNAVPENIRVPSKEWYPSARNVASDMSETHGISKPQSAGVIAALSPQKDWHMNASLAKRVTDVYTNQQDTAWTKQMDIKAKELSARTASLKAPLKAIRGKTLSELTDPAEKAMWVRLYDEAHNPRQYEIYSPDGTVKDVARNKDGTPSKVAWGSNDSIAKALSILDDGSIRNISDQLGDQHKVRNFYNNIIDPHGKFGDVTIDTHAVAAAHWQPLAGGDTQVLHNFGGQPKGEAGPGGSVINGTSGTYGLYADAYRLAAKKLGILPREIQSITWEGIRSLFPPEFKTIANKAIIEQVWKEVDRGKITPAQARRRIIEKAGGFSDPEWLANASSDAASQSAHGSQDVSGSGVHGKPSKGVERGGRAARAAAVP